MVRVTTGIAEFDAYFAVRGGPPPAVTNAHEVDRGARALTVSRKTRRLERLAELSGLRRLVVRAPNDAMLAAIGGATRVEDLELCGGTMTTLSPLAGLRKLRYLTISVASRMRTLDGLDHLIGLRYLSIWHCAAITSIAALAGLRRLRYVYLDGNMYKPMRLDSLAALATLRNLEVLVLHNVSVRDGDWSPVHDLRKLTRAELPARSRP